MDPISPFAHLPVEVAAILISTGLVITNFVLNSSIKTAIAQMARNLEKGSENQQTSATEIMKNQQVMAANQVHVTDGMSRIVDRLIGIVESVKE